VLVPVIPATLNLICVVASVMSLIENLVSETSIVIVSLERVLFVRVSTVSRPTRVSVEVGRVSVPVLVMELITGAVSVLFVRVSVVARPTRVSVASGRVITLLAV